MNNKNTIKKKKNLYSKSIYIQYEVATLGGNEAFNYKIKRIEIKDDIFRKKLLHIQILADIILNKIDIKAPVNNNNQMKTRFYDEIK